MIESIAGLSALGAGLLGPAALRRAPGSQETNPQDTSSQPIEDRLDLVARPEEGAQRSGLYRSDGSLVDKGAQASSQTTGHDANRVSGEPELTEEQRAKVAELEKRDQEVRAHEQAHKAAGGGHAGAISYSYETGPDGKRYATGGEVSIDASPVPGDPQATITKMQQVRRAALAPAQPSAQDRRVAAQASREAQKARAELREQKAGGEPGNKPGAAASVMEKPAEAGTLLDVTV